MSEKTLQDRLLEPAEGFGGNQSPLHLEAKARIDALEAEKVEIKALLAHSHNAVIRQQLRAEAAEAQLAEAREALKKARRGIIEGLTAHQTQYLLGEIDRALTNASACRTSTCKEGSGE